jgi:acetyl esterase/lipase
MRRNLSFEYGIDTGRKYQNMGWTEYIGYYDALTTIFFNLHGGGWNQGPLDTAAT